MYVKVNGSKVLYNGDMNDIKVTEWQEWNIDLAEFGIDLNDVNSLAIGFGDENNMTPAGTGKVYFDDIRLYQPRCVHSLLKPPADFTNDCTVNHLDLEVMTDEWLAISPELEADLYLDNNVDLRDFAILAEQWLDEQLWPPD